MASERAPVRVIVHMGAQGLAGYLLPAVLVLLGLLLWFNPRQHLFYAVLAVVLSLGTWVTSNLGGFIVGLLLGVIGGSLAFGWTPDGSPTRPGPTHRRSVTGWLRRKRLRVG